MKKLTVTVVVVVLLVKLSVVLNAADWPQYRGPNQDGIYPEKVNLNWPTGGPKVIWKVPTQNGFSSFAVVGNKVFIQVNREINGALREICVAMDAATGKELWFTDMGIGKYDGGAGPGDGPRSTPTVNDGMVYTFNQHLVLFCLDAATGKLVWSKDLMKDHAGRNIGWKSAASPVVDGNLVFVAGGGPGQSFLASNKKTGEIVWKVEDEIITHSTPVVATILDVRQVIFFVKSGLVSVAPGDGKLLWKFPFNFKVSTAISPVVSGDIVYCSAGYDVGSGACKISREGSGLKATEMWKIPGNKPIANHWSTPVCKDGYLYGMFSFKQFKTGPMKCVELATGKVMWEQPGFGPGNVILVNNKLLALADDGQLVLIEAVPTAYKEIARVQAVTGKSWSTPAFSDGRVYVRSAKEGTCLDFTGK
ncbi:MAG: PQQ-binding-like beta-propeller repeat protein [Kiritimatiellae bacterium]|nr:PQQ-binding-like beta-propeller repeat protein [Kiritimatiellia bacterium]